MTVLQFAIQFHYKDEVVPKSLKSRKPQLPRPASPLMVRLDADSKACLAEAAELRKVSVSDYVRTVTVAQARREVAGARNQSLVLTPDEFLAFWQALQEPVRLSAAQKKLGAIMRGEE